jgi:hypothetical protein
MLLLLAVLCGPALAEPIDPGEPDLSSRIPRQQALDESLKASSQTVEREGRMSTLPAKSSLFVRPMAGAKVESLDLASHGFALKRTLPQLGLSVIQGPTTKVPEMLAALQSDRRVAWVHRDSERELHLVPNDGSYAEQWNLPRVGLEQAWDITTGSNEIVVAVLDSGLCRDIDDFSGRIVSPYSVPAASSDWPAWDDVLGHGTSVSTVAAAKGNDGFGLAGAAWDVSIMPVHLTDTETFSLESEILGIVWAVENGADVINISGGSIFPAAAEELAIRYALGQGVVVVAAAGNSGPRGQVAYPAGYDGVIAVGATTSDDERAPFSSIGAALDLVAPGQQVPVWTADETSYGMTLMDGTSLAAPLVSGIVALMLSEDPTLTPAEIEDLLVETAEDLGRPGWDSRYGNGLVDAAALVQMAGDGTRAEPFTFSDVPEGYPYFQAIHALARAGVVEGYGDGTYRPDQRVTREEFTKMLLLTMDQIPEGEMVAPFDDVPAVPGLSLDDYVALAAELGITEGVTVSPPLFMPSDRVLRAQVTTMSVRAADTLRAGALDAPPSGYEASYAPFSQAHDYTAAKATFNGLLDRLVAVGPWYDPWRPAYRGEVAAMLAPLVGM